MGIILDNYNAIFVLSQNIDKNNYKSSVLWVLISCCLLLLFFPGLNVHECCRFYLSKDRLRWLSFIACKLLSEYIYFRYQNTKKIVFYRCCFRVYTSRCMTLCSIFMQVMATISVDLSECTKYTLTIWITVLTIWINVRNQE